MESSKCVTKTVSMRESLWEAIDDHAKSIGEDRSSFLRKLAQEALAAAGKLPSQERAEIQALVEAAMSVDKDGALKASLEGFVVEAMQRRCA